MRFWLSWHQPGEDFRPLAYPPNAAILGWWLSGRDANDVATLCALVTAEDETAAKQAVRIDWPEAERWRFCNQVADDFLPGDRFPLKPWMKERAGQPQPVTRS